MTDTQALTALLDKVHKQQVLHYLKYFRTKRAQQLHDIKRNFDEIRDMRLLENMYTLDEVTAILDALFVLVKSNVQEDLENFTHQSVLYLREMFLQAEGQHATLRIDTGILDNEALLAGIKSVDVDKFELKDAPEPVPRKLATLNNAVDVKLVTKLKETEESKQQLSARLEQLEQQLKDLQKENAALKDAKSSLSTEFSSFKTTAQSAMANDANARDAELTNLKRELAAVKRDAVEAKKQLDEKLNKCTQFQEMKRLLMRKNQQLKEARAGLDGGSSPKNTANDVTSPSDGEDDIEV